jgi:ribonucleoside-diphosphate reductase alpha chain
MEELVEERIIDPKTLTKTPQAPRSGHIRPMADPSHGTNGNGHGVNGNGTNGNGTNGNGHHAAPHSPAFKNGSAQAVASAPASTTAEKVRLARLKGYEGDPCSECGQLTLVRSGACCKCDTCGASSGCS